VLRNLLSAKTALAFLIVCGGAYVAGQMPGIPERMTVMAVTSLIALFIAADFEDRNDEIKDYSSKTISVKLTEHPLFQDFLDAASDPVLVVEAARVIKANKAALHLLGSNIVDQNVRIAFRHAGAIERLSDPTAQHDGRPINLVGIGLRDQIWEMRIRSVAGNQKLVYLTDRTGAQAAEKMRVDFVANASHELLTPLAAIKGFIETLEEPEAGGNPKTRARFLGIMESEASRMQALIRDLMSLSRIEAEKYELSAIKVDMEQVINDVVAPLKAIPDTRGEDILLNIAPELPPVSGDRGMLGQLVSNIVANAMKYGRAGTPINVTLAQSRSSNMLALTVSDQGDGIAPEHIPRLTERFYRVDSGRSRSVGGTGLGLSLVKHIVDGHRGHLEIKSDVGKGTSITILLPVATVEAGLGEAGLGGDIKAV
jgi:two-component system, OmpR family, phosphate regulon sensor histidine kinase PhoR